MTERLAQYRGLERRLWMARWQCEGEESADEDGILDEMERVWKSLSEDECRLLNQEAPRCWPMESSSWPPDPAESHQTFAPMPWTYEGFHSAEDTILSDTA